MKKTDRIFIAGHKGLVGSSVFKTLKDAGFNNLIINTNIFTALNDIDIIIVFI